MELDKGRIGIYQEDIRPVGEQRQQNPWAADKEHVPEDCHGEMRLKRRVDV